MPVDNLKNLLDALTDTSVYVIEEETHRLLFFNRRCRDIGRGKAKIGVKCHEVWPEVCADCPLPGLGEKGSNHLVCFDPLLNTSIDVTANRLTWDGGIPAVVITATPHRLNFEEEQGVEKIKRIYAESLVTIFDECVIVNLTKDFYVNCQKNQLWSEFPEHGNFGEENILFAQKTVHPDDLEEFLANFSRNSMLRLFGEGKKQISKRLRRITSDGTYHIMEFTAVAVESLGDGQCWGVLVYRDVQDEVLQEQNRHVEISQLTAAVRTAYQMLIAVNLSKNTFHMLGYERYPVEKPGDEGCFDDLIQREIETVHPDYRTEFRHKFERTKLVEAFESGEKMITMEVPHIGADGKYHWHFTQVVRVDSPYTDDLIEITLSRNIDEERRIQQETLKKEQRAKLVLEDALQKAENASRAKSDFLSRMSHDIRTPMNTIVGMTELAQRHIGKQEKTKDYLEKIARSGAHLLGLINEILDVSKIESGTVDLANADFDLRELIQEAVGMVRISTEAKTQELTVRFHTEHTAVRGDARRLKQVLVNVLENASKYTPKNGRISVEVFELKKEDRRVGTYRFVIEDNGVGMRKEYLDHIFEPFSRADDSRISKITGTGLGMTIVKNLVTLMGGTIQIESDYGKGSRFTITVCLDKRNGHALPSARKPLSADSGERLDARVLLVEDNELNRQIAKEMLELLGARVETVYDGREAVNAVRAHPADYYDAVFMDVQMPVLNGYDATREIRADGYDKLPIIAMTADAFAEDEKLARLAGMNGHLAKPISVQQLKSSLIDALERKKN